MGMTPRASTVASAGQLDFIVGAIVEQTFGEVDRNEDGVIDEREFGEACEGRPELLRGVEFAEGLLERALRVREGGGGEGGVGRWGWCC